jgi:hypothetical protein
MAAYPAEMIATSRDLLAYSKALPQEKPTTTFPGNAHHPTDPN